jgi:hypothetical protein
MIYKLPISYNSIVLCPSSNDPFFAPGFTHLIRERTHFAICRRMVTERKKIKKISSLKGFLLTPFNAWVCSLAGPVLALLPYVTFDISAEKCVTDHKKIIFFCIPR